MKKRWLAGLMTHQYKKLPVTMKMWMQFNVVRRAEWRLVSVLLMCAERGRPAMILAAALSTDCRRRRRYAGMSRCHNILFTIRATLPTSVSSVSLTVVATANRFESGEVQQRSPQVPSQRGFSSADQYQCRHQGQGHEPKTMARWSRNWLWLE